MPLAGARAGRYLWVVTVTAAALTHGDIGMLEDLGSAQIRDLVDIDNLSSLYGGEVDATWEEDPRTGEPTLAVLHLRGVKGRLAGWFHRLDVDALWVEFRKEQNAIEAEGGEPEGLYGFDGDVQMAVNNAKETALLHLKRFAECVGVVVGRQASVCFEQGACVAAWCLSYGLSRRFVLGRDNAVMTYACADDKDLVIQKSYKMQEKLAPGGQKFFAEARKFIMDTEKSVESFVRLLADQGVGRCL